MLCRIDPKPKEKILEHLAYGLEVLRGKREHEKFITRLDARSVYTDKQLCHCGWINSITTQIWKSYLD